MEAGSVTLLMQGHANLVLAEHNSVLYYDLFSAWPKFLRHGVDSTTAPYKTGPKAGPPPLPRPRGGR